MNPNRIVLTLIVVFAFLLSVAPTYAAATLYVSPTGNDDNAGTQAAPYKTIQAAINNAASGDTVTLEDGTYSGNGNREVVIADKILTLNSRNGASKTIIDYGRGEKKYYRVFNIRGDKTNLIINGITITTSAVGVELDLNRSDYGAVYIASQGAFQANDCIFTRNPIGIVNQGAALTLTNCTFSQNKIGGILTNSNSSLSLSNCAFISNEGTGLAGSGAKLSLRKCVFKGNLRGGAETYGLVTASDCTFSNNLKKRDGGAGGGLSISPKTFNDISLVERCTFTDNVAVQGGGVYVHDGSKVMLKDCIFTANVAAYGNGGGISDLLGDITLVKCAFRGNKAYYGGGGMYSNAEKTALTNCTFTGNIATRNNGGAILGSEKKALILEFCSLFGNAAQGATALGGAIGNEGNATLTNCILWGNTAPNAPAIGNSAKGNPTTTVTYCDIQGGLSGMGNIKADPLFVDALNGNLHLKPGSPCIATGLAATGSADAPGALDLEGKKRANPPTMGAYEGAQTAAPSK